MSIKNKLYIGVAISFILAVLFISIVLIASGEIAKKSKEHDRASKIELAISELNIVMYEYLLYHEKRMRQQWISKYNSIMEILRREEEVKKLTHTDYATLGNLFSQITVNYEKRQKLIQEGAFQAKIDIPIMFEERLVAQLLIKSHSIISDASMFAEKLQAEATEIQRIATMLGSILVIFFAFTVTTALLVIARSISKPLKELTKGTEIIGKGDLDHKVEIKTKDELGQLAAAFNQMTERRKEAEKALRQSEAKYQDLFDSAPAAYFSVGIDGLIKEANKVAETLTGYRSEELKKMKAFNLYAEESKEKAKGLLEKFRSGISWENEEMIYERKDGHKIHGLLSISTIKDENDRVLESRSVVVDITERKQAEEEILKLNEDLEKRVLERTAELQKTINLMAGREMRMAELKEVIKKLHEQVESGGMTPIADDPLKEMGKSDE